MLNRQPVDDLHAFPEILFSPTPDKVCGRSPELPNHFA
jgi:hypothetical protein